MSMIIIKTKYCSRKSNKMGCEPLILEMRTPVLFSHKRVSFPSLVFLCLSPLSSLPSTPSGTLTC